MAACSKTFNPSTCCLLCWRPQCDAQRPLTSSYVSLVNGCLCYSSTSWKKKVRKIWFNIPSQGLRNLQTIHIKCLCSVQKGQAQRGKQIPGNDASRETGAFYDSKKEKPLVKLPPKGISYFVCRLPAIRMNTLNLIDA